MMTHYGYSYSFVLGKDYVTLINLLAVFGLVFEQSGQRGLAIEHDLLVINFPYLPHVF